MRNNKDDKMYEGIPLSVIYKQLIRFMKENGIYAPYLEISLPQTNMSYETFLNVLSYGPKGVLIKFFFLYTYNVGSDYEGYAKYAGSYALSKASSFLHEMNNKWMSYFSNFSEAYKKWQNPQQI